MINKPLRVLAIDPVRRGASFATLEWPLALIDWGVRNTRAKQEGKNIDFISRLVEQYQPSVIIVEDFTDKVSLRSPRVKTLINQISRYAAKQHIRVKALTREEVRQVFQTFGGKTKYGIAKTITSQFPELAPIMPRFRKPWMSADHRMPIFTATSLALTYLYTRNGRKDR